MTVLAVHLEKYVCGMARGKEDANVMILVPILKTLYVDQMAKRTSMNVNSTLLHASTNG